MTGWLRWRVPRVLFILDGCWNVKVFWFDMRGLLITSKLKWEEEVRTPSLVVIIIQYRF